jgi:hypothetical protein
MAAAAAATLIVSLPITDEIGLALAAVFAFLVYRKVRRSAVSQAAGT